MMILRFCKIRMVLLVNLMIVLTLSACSTNVSLHPNAHYSPDMIVAIVDVEHTPALKFDFFYLIGGSGELPCNVAPVLEEKIIDQGFFNVADRSQIDKILEEQKLQSSDLMNPATAVEIGKLAGLDAVMTVRSIGKFNSVIYNGDSFECNARLIDCKTGLVIGSLNSHRLCLSLIVPWWPLVDNNNWLASKIATGLEKEIAKKVAFYAETENGE